MQIFSIILTCLTFNPINTQANENIPFDVWIKNIEKLALNKGIASETIQKSLNGVKPNKRVLELDSMQPEFTLTLDTYLSNATPRSRVKKGKDLYQEHALLFNEIYEVYKVQPRFIIALWGIETNFGMYTGSFNVIRSLATLSHDLRRRDFFTKEIINALTIIDQGHIEPDDMMGSWAGAMGQNQFMPSSFLNYAQDFNNDGKKNIWTDTEDSLASIARYLQGVGSNKWDSNYTWGREVIPPLDIKQIESDLFIKREKGCLAVKKLSKKLPLSEFRTIGFTKMDGSKLDNINLDSYLLKMGRKEGDFRYFIVYKNYLNILSYNCSNYYGLSVGLLSDKFK